MVALIKGEGPGLGNSAAAIIATAVFLALAAAAMYGVGRRIGRRTPTEPALPTVHSQTVETVDGR